MPTYSSMWNPITLDHGTSSSLVSASRNANCEFPLANITFAPPRSSTAFLMADAASAAASTPSSAAVANTRTSRSSTRKADMSVMVRAAPMVKFGAVVPQGWKLELSGMKAAEAWETSKAVARKAESLGYDHLWVYDHVETVPRREPTHVFEAFTMLAAVAQLTNTIRLGQLVTCAAYRNAGLLAKEAACVDVFSGGRLVFGIGAGWYEREYQAYGY